MDDSVLRVVVVRHGKVKPADFRLREGEPDASAILEAVRSAGKQGALGIIEIPVPGTTISREAQSAKPSAMDDAPSEPLA